MEQFVIQKFFGIGEPDAKENQNDWKEAFGIKARSYPRAGDDEQAKVLFEQEIRRCRSGRFRLIRFGGGGYGTYVTVVASKSFS